MPTQQGYIGRNPGDGRTVINRQTSHVTTGVQTSFTMSVGYEVGFLDVYLNGIKQTETLDYTASDGSTINFSPSFAPMNGDVLEFIAFETLNVTNIKSARRNFNVGRDLTVDGSVTIGSSLTVATDLVVNGTFTTINTEILDVEDKTVGIASTSSPSNTTADGAGIVIYGGSDGDKSLTWNSTKSNFVLVGGGVSIGTGVTISTPADNVLAFSVNSAEKARFNNFGAFTVGYEGEAWHESTYVGVLQAGSGAWIGQTPGAGARAEWVNNAYYDSVNTRWEYIAADEANRIYLENGELHLQSAASGSADGLITWNERLAMTVGGDFKIGPNAGIGITISSSGNVDAIGIITASSFKSTNINSNSNEVELFYNSEKVFYTRGDGIQVQNTDGDGVIYVVGSEGNEAIIKLHADDGDDNADKFQIVSHADGYLAMQNFVSGAYENNIKAFGDGAVELYHNHIKKFETTLEGISVDKAVTIDGSTPELRMKVTSDSQSHRIRFFNNADSQVARIFGDPSTGNLSLQTGTNGAENAIRVVANGSVELYYDGTKKFETKSGGAEVQGYFTAGKPTDYWSTVSSYINVANYGGLGTHGAYEVTLTAGGYRKVVGGSSTWEDYTVNSVAGFGAQIALNPTNGNIIFRTESGMSSGDSSVITERMRIHDTGEIQIPDNGKFTCGASNDLQIYHNGTRSEIINSTGDFIIQASQNNKLMLRAQTGESHLIGYHNAQVEIYYDGSKKLQTQTEGTKTFGRHLITGNSDIDNQGNPLLFLQDSTNGNMKAVFLLEDDYTTGRGALAINVGESGVTNDRDLILQRAGGRVGIRCVPTEGFEVAGPSKFNGTSHTFSSGSSGDCKLIIEADTDNNDENDNPLIVFKQDGGVEESAIGHGIIGSDDNKLTIANSVTGGYIDFCTGSVNGYTNAIESMRIRSGGDVTTTGDSGFTRTTAGFTARKGDSFNVARANGTPVEIVRTGNTGNMINFFYGSSSVASISYNGSNMNYGGTSDYRLKENIVEMTGGIDAVKKLKPIKFNFITTPEKTVEGFIAHEVQEVIPQAVTGDKDCEVDEEGIGYQQLDPAQLVPTLTTALQESITRIETLEAKVAALEGS